MIAAADHVGARVEQFLVDRLGDAEAAGRVLAIDDDAVELPVAHEARQALRDHRAPRTPHYVADEQKPHSGLTQIDRLALR